MFETPVQTLDPGQSFTTLLNITNNTLPPGWHAFNVTATMVANQTSAGATYYLMEEGSEQAPAGSEGTGGQGLDHTSEIESDSSLGIAGIIVGVAYFTRKRKRSRNFGVV